MEAEQRIQALEQEVQILKNQIQSILLDIQTHLLTNAYPALRGHHTAGGSSTEDEEDDDEYDRAAPAPKVRKVTSNNPAPAKREKAARPEPETPAEPMMASLDEQQSWVLENIQSEGVDRTRELVEELTKNRRITPEVADTLMRFTDIYAAAADEPTLPSRPAGMPTNPITVKAVTAPPTKQPAKPRAPQQAIAAAPAPQPVKQAPKPTVVKPRPAAPIVEPPVEQPAQSFEGEPAANNAETEASSLVLRLIAGVQNAGAGVRWGKNKN